MFLKVSPKPSGPLCFPWTKGIRPIILLFNVMNVFHKLIIIIVFVMPFIMNFNLKVQVENKKSANETCSSTTYYYLSQMTWWQLTYCEILLINLPVEHKFTNRFHNIARDSSYCTFLYATCIRRIVECSKQYSGQTQGNHLTCKENNLLMLLGICAVTR